MPGPLATDLPPVAPPADSEFLRDAPWIAAGGSLGALSRGGVATLLAGSGWDGLAATQAVNLVGAFALGGLLAVLEATGGRPRLRAFLGIGLLGSFTTYSALVADARSLGESTSPGVALAFLAGSIVLGLAAFLAGRALARAGCAGRTRSAGRAGGAGGAGGVGGVDLRDERRS